MDSGIGSGSIWPTHCSSFERNAVTTKLHLEKQFGRLVGGVLMIVGTWTVWRGAWVSAGQVAAACGLLLLVLAFLAPRALIYPCKAWMALAEALSFVSTRIILGIVFFLGVLPIGLVMRFRGWDPLGSRKTPSTYWRPYSARQQNPKHFEQMF